MVRSIAFIYTLTAETLVDGTLGGVIVFVRIFGCSILACLGMTPKRHGWNFLYHNRTLDQVLDADLEVQPVSVHDDYLCDCVLKEEKLGG